MGWGLADVISVSDVEGEGVGVDISIVRAASIVIVVTCIRVAITQVLGRKAIYRKIGRTFLWYNFDECLCLVDMPVTSWLYS